MTENTFMPQQAPEGGTSRTTLLVAGGLVAAVVLGGGGYVLLSGGGDDLESTGAPVVKRTTTTTTKTTVPVKKPATKPAAAKPGVLPAKTTVRIGRDPFKALYVQSVAAPAAAPTTAPTGTGTTGTGTSAGTSTTPGTTVGAVYALTLKKIATSGETKLYTFDVAGQAKTVIAAQRFGKYGELIVLGWFKSSKGTPIGALIQVGDDEPIEIKIGEKLTVQ